MQWNSVSLITSLQFLDTFRSISLNKLGIIPEHLGLQMAVADCLSMDLGVGVVGGFFERSNLWEHVNLSTRLHKLVITKKNDLQQLWWCGIFLHWHSLGPPKKNTNLIWGEIVISLWFSILVKFQICFQEQCGHLPFMPRCIDSSLTHLLLGYESHSQQKIQKQHNA